MISYEEMKFIYANKAFHEDISVTNNLYNVTVSFYWRNLLNGKWFETVNDWTTSSHPPNYIVMGFTK